MKNKTLSLVSVATGSLILSLPALAQSSAVLADRVQSELSVQVYDLQTLDVPATPDSNFATRITLEGQPFTLIAHQHSLRSDDFQLLVQDEAGIRAVDAPPPATFRGELAELPGSVVTASLIDGQLFATIRHDSWLSFGIHPASRLDPAQAADAYVVYNTLDTLWADVECGLHLTGNPVGSQPLGPPTHQLGTGLRMAEIAIDSDVQFFNDEGGSVNAAMNKIENIMNGVDSIYQSQNSVIFDITAIVIRTAEPDPYDQFAAGALLNQFSAVWQGTMDFVKRDLAHLFTGRNLNGSTIGVATFGGTCGGPGRYGLSERFTSNVNTMVGLASHEIGHNFAASHCNEQPTISNPCRIMCNNLGGCTGNIGSFGPLAVTQITNFAAGANCLRNLQDPLTVPFSIGFNNASIGAGNWPTEQGAIASDAGVNEPSAPRSLNLDSVNGNDFADDFIRSNFFLLAAESDLSLKYFTEHRGVEAGEMLFIEYLNAAGNWQTLNTIVSDGVDQNNFVFHEQTLPANAYHDQFRLQLRVDGDQANDDWYIDDILLDGNVLCPNPGNYCTTSPNSFGPGALISSFGSTNIASNDFTLSVVLAATTQSGIFYYGPVMDSAPFGDGVRCVGPGAIGTFRLDVVQTDVFGSAVFAVDNTDPPTANGQLTAGATWFFQFWYRDPQGPGGSGFNLSDGLEVTFCP